MKKDVFERKKNKKTYLWMQIKVKFQRERAGNERAGNGLRARIATGTLSTTVKAQLNKFIQINDLDSN